MILSERKQNNVIYFLKKMIKKNLTILFFITVFAFSTLYGENFSINKEFVNNLATIISEPLFNYNNDMLNSIITQYFNNNQSIYGITIRDIMDNKNVFKYYREDNNRIIRQKNIPDKIKKLNSITTDIIYQNSLNIGKLTIYFLKAEKFTIEEKQWIKNNPNIKLAVMSYWPKDENGNSYPVEIIKLMNRYARLNILPYRYDKWKDGFEDAAKGKNVHGIMELSYSKEREEKYFYYSIPYRVTPLYLITRDNYRSYLSFNKLDNQTIYVKEKSISQKIVKEKCPDCKILYFENNKNQYKKLINNKNADAIVSYFVDKDSLKKYHLKIADTIYNKYGEVAIGINHKYPILVNIINKALRRIPKYELKKLESKKFSTGEVLFSLKEQEWIKNHPIIKFCINPTWAPIEFIDKNGNYSGLSSSYIEYIYRKTGIKFQLIKTNSWSKSIEKIKNKDADMLPCLQKTNEQMKFLNFSIPYLSFPVVVVTTLDKPFFNDIEELYGKTVVIIKNYAVENYLSQFNRIKLLYVDSVHKALQYVAGKKCYAFVSVLPVASYYMSKDGFLNLKISGKMDLTLTLSMGVRNDWNGTGLNIINKILNSVSTNDRKKIYNKWVSVTIEKKMDYSLLWKVLSIVAIIFIIIFYWNRKLKKEINHRIKVEKELKKEKEQFERIISELPIPILIVDRNSHKILFANENSEHVYKMSKDELVGSDIDILYTSPTQREEILSAVSSDGSLYNFETQFILKDNRKIDAFLSLIPIKFNGVDSNLGAIADITKLKQTEKALKKETQKAKMASKSKSEFLSNMSHEIRTPMNAIIGLSRLALETDSPEKQKNYIEKIDKSAKSLLGIINDILDFSKIEAGKLTLEKINFDLFETISNVINIISFQAYEKNLELIVDYDENLGKEFYGDSLRISQILTNLLSNAVKFTEKGEIKLTVKEVGENMVRFEVKDTGIGISKEQQRKLFKSFSQADSSTTRKFGGTGLGLSISKELCKLMNGNISLESEIGKGSKFIVEIELEKVKVEKPSYTLFSGKKVLVIDDNNSRLEIMKRLLTSFGLDVVCMDSGKKGMEKLENENFDLIFLDWNMTGVDSISTIKLLKEKYSDKILDKIIIVTAFKEENLLSAIDDVGIKLFLEKPVNPTVLNDMLSDIFLGTSKMGTIEREKNKKSLKHSIRALKGSKILLVEDNETNREIVSLLLKNSGINISFASNGKEAVDIFNRSKDFDLILMDIQMPVMDGYEATKKIRETDKNIPIIALTANAMKEDIERTKEAGMNEHLNKPIDVEKLYATLLKYISPKTDEVGIVEKDKENHELPDFENLDKEYALKLVFGNKKIYLNILKGLYKFKNLDLESLDNEEFKRKIHTIKGISASAGALELHKIAKELDESQNKTLIPKFYEEFDKVINEIEEKVIRWEEKIEKIKIDKTGRDELFAKLKEALKTKRVKNIKPVVDEFEKYDFSDEDKELFEQIKQLTKKFQFKKALELLI